MSAAVALYAFGHGFYVGQLSWLNSTLVLGYLIWSLFLYALAKNVATKPYLTDWYRYMGIFSDNVYLSVGFYFAGATGGPLFLVYLWVAFGNGIRFGTPYMTASAGLAFLGFVVLMYVSPYWGAPSHIYTSVGLALSLIVLPMYVNKLLAQLTDALQKAEIANDTKQNFIANMNHELRTPLTSIIQACVLLKKRSGDYENNDLMKIISNSAKHQLDIVNQILDFSKISSDKVEKKLLPINLFSIIKEVSDIITPNCKEKNLKLHICMDSNINPNVLGNDVMIKQVLLNLCGNAVKFTENGYVFLTAVLREQEQGVQKIHIHVKDTGIGIDDSLKERIFEPFNQGNDSITRKYGGTGLGITISKEYAQFMGGDLILDNEQTSGTQFTLILNLDIDTSVQQNKLYSNRYMFTIGFDSEQLRSLNLYNRPDITIAPIDDRMVAEQLLEDNEFSDQAVTNILVNLDAPDKLERCAIFPECASRYSLIGYHQGDMSRFDSEVLRYFSTLLDGRKDDVVIDRAIEVVNLINNFDEATLTEGTGAYIDKTLSILAVEDTDSLRKIVKMIFQEQGHNITTCEDGFAGLEALNQGEFDVVIADMHMPGMTGVEMVKNYKLLNPDDNTAFVLMTADSLNKDEEVQELFSDVLSKPILPSKLLERVYAVCEQDSVTEEPEPEVAIAEAEAEEKKPTSNTTVLFNEYIINELVNTASKEYFVELVEIYTADSSINLDSLDVAFRERNMDDIRDIFHKIEGSSAMIGAVGIGEYIRDVKRKSPSNLFAEGEAVMKRLRLLNTHAVNRLNSLATNSLS